MARVLLTFHGLAERRLATHRGVLLARRGIDVDLASEENAYGLPGEYDRIIPAVELELARFPARPGAAAGTLRIVGAPPPEPAPITAPPAPPARWAAPAGLATAFVLAFVAGLAGLPPYGQVVLGVFTAGAATHAFRTLIVRMPTAQEPSCLRSPTATPPWSGAPTVRARG